MNIFILDYTIAKCVKFHCDKHVIKMLTEEAQIICTVANEHGITTPYKSTHLNHPCVIWAKKSQANWLWLKKFAKALNNEYRYRYTKKINHKAFDVIKNIKTPNLPKLPRTEFPKVVPEKYKNHIDIVTAYRIYYANEKNHFAKWTRRKRPFWFHTSYSKEQ